jgi:hypothetical protein
VTDCLCVIHWFADTVTLLDWRVLNHLQLRLPRDMVDMVRAFNDQIVNLPLFPTRLRRKCHRNICVTLSILKITNWCVFKTS